MNSHLCRNQKGLLWLVKVKSGKFSSKETVQRICAYRQVENNGHCKDVYVNNESCVKNVSERVVLWS